MNKIIFYIELLFSYLIYALGGAIATATVGYILGTIIGLAATFYNNNFMPEAPEISYFWWANFFGYIFVCFAVLPGAGIGVVFRLIKLSEERDSKQVMRRLFSFLFSKIPCFR